MGAAAAPRFSDIAADVNTAVCVVQGGDDHRCSLVLKSNHVLVLGDVFENRSCFAYSSCLGRAHLVLVTYICNTGG